MIEGEVLLHQSEGQKLIHKTFLKCIKLCTMTETNSNSNSKHSVNKISSVSLSPASEASREVANLT